MPDLAIAADGFAHAIFVAGFFEGPIERYWAESSDGGVVTAGVNAPDMLIVAPVTNGAASITVTASGPGGTATQTFTARVGAGATVPNRSSQPQPPPAPPPPPAPAPPPPPADDSDDGDMTPTDDDLPPLPPATSTDDAVPTETLPPLEPTAAPTLSGTVPAQTVSVGGEVTVDMSQYFVGIVQDWEVATSNSSVVQASTPSNGRVRVQGVSTGTGTVTVTATNTFGSVAQAFQVTVETSSGTTTTTTAARSGGTGIPLLQGPNPVVGVNFGATTTLDLSTVFANAGTYSVQDVPSGVEITISGSTATIRGVTRGTHTVTLVAHTTNASINRPATIVVT